jgi:hypothetical protein
MLRSIGFVVRRCRQCSVAQSQKGGQRLPVAVELGERLGVLEAVLLAEDLERAACFDAGVGPDDLPAEPLRASPKALREAFDHVPGGVEPAALLTRAGEHVPQCGPRAEGAFTDHEPGLVHPAALEITAHGSPAVSRLAIAVLSTASSSLTPSSRGPMMISRPQLRVLPKPDVDVDPVHIQV